MKLTEDLSHKLDSVSLNSSGSTDSNSSYSSLSSSPVPSPSTSSDQMIQLSDEHREMLDEFRQWVIDSPQFINSRLDDSFLLRFLRVRKFNLEEAKSVFVKYFKVRELHPHCYRNLDIMDPLLGDLMDRGYMFPLPQRDPHGRRVIFGRSAMFGSCYGHRPTDLFRAIIMTFETLMEDEVNQENGFVYVFDSEGVVLSEVMYVGIFEMQRLAQSGEKALPMKHKQVHWLNLPTFIMHCYNFVASFISEKLRKRLIIHKNLESLHEAIPPEILPKEYGGGDISWQDMAKDWVTVLRERRDALVALDEMHYDESRTKKSSKSHHSHRNENKSTSKPKDQPEEADQGNFIYRSIRRTLYKTKSSPA